MFFASPLYYQDFILELLDTDQVGADTLIELSEDIYVQQSERFRQCFDYFQKPLPQAEVDVHAKLLYETMRRRKVDLESLFVAGMQTSEFEAEEENPFAEVANANYFQVYPTFHEALKGQSRLYSIRQPVILLHCAGTQNVSHAAPNYNKNRCPICMQNAPYALCYKEDGVWTIEERPLSQ